MIKKLSTILIVIMISVFTLTFVNVNASDEMKINVDNKEVNVLIDPVIYTDTSSGIENITKKVVLYTPFFPYETTKRTEDVTEYTFEFKDNKYSLVKVGDKNSYIPLNGLVLSVPTADSLAFNVGDILDPMSNVFVRHNYAIKNQDGVRIAFTAINESRKSSTFTYYNVDKGATTGTNKYGSEMVVEYDSKINSFKVIELGKGGDSAIPQAGFVMSTSGLSEQMLLEGVLFKKNDKIELIDLDFVTLEESFTRPFNQVNGTRLENYLVVYPAASNPPLKTGQNIYGYEVAVNKDGYVTGMGNLMKIPEGGFVLSGNGTSSDFLIQKIKYGAKITYDEATKIITVRNILVDQVIRTVEKDRLEAKNTIDEANEQMLDLDTAFLQEKFDKAEDYYNELKAIEKTINTIENPDELISAVVEFKKAAANLEPIYPEIYLNSRLSRRIDSRGVWHRPNESNLSDIEKNLDFLASMNFTDIYVETFWNGYLVYPSELAPYQTKIGKNFGEYGNDYLLAFITEAKKRGMLVHAWVENFFVGVPGHYSSLWDDHPDWRIKNYNGTEAQTGKPHGEEEGFLFFDPANPEVQQFVLSIYDEMVKKYDLAGLQLDYIRYPSVNTDLNFSSGYTEFAMNEFKEQNNLTGDVRKLIKNKEILAKWDLYRQGKINDFVDLIHTNIRPLNKDLNLSIAVGPDPTFAPRSLMQDWKKWVENGWIDLVLPMVYVNDVSQVISTVIKSKEITGNISLNYTGLSPTYDNLPDIYNATYTEASIKSGAHGTAIFASHNLVRNEGVVSILNTGTYRNKAVSPHEKMDKLLETFVEDILHKADSIYVRNNVMTRDQRNSLEKELNALKSKKYQNPSEFRDLYVKIDTLFLSLSAFINEGAGRLRMMEDIEYFMEVIDIKISRYLVNYGFWDKTVTPERPSVDDFDYPVIKEEEAPKKYNTVIYILIASVLAVGLAAGGTVFYLKKVKK